MGKQGKKMWRYALAGVLACSFAAAADVPSLKAAPMTPGDPSFCVAKDDGSYRHPDCRVRYVCSGGLATQVACPDGQVFDSAKNPDDDPSKGYCSLPAQAQRYDCSGIALIK